MIEGLKVTVSGVELRKLCNAEVNRQLSRVETYRQQLANFEHAKVEAAQFTGGDPIRALKDKLHDHENSAKEMEFVAEHLVPTETYLLDWAALHKLGIVSKQY